MLKGLKFHTIIGCFQVTWQWRGSIRNHSGGRSVALGKHSSPLSHLLGSQSLWTSLGLKQVNNNSSLSSILVCFESPHKVPGPDQGIQLCPGYPIANCSIDHVILKPFQPNTQRQKCQTEQNNQLKGWKWNSGLLSVDPVNFKRWSCEF